MPSAFIYLGIMLAAIIIWFVIFKRPVYEAVLISFLIIVTVTNSWSNIFTYIDSALSTSLIFSMIVFVALSQLLEKTKIIDSCMAIILAFLGRVPGGAGYVSVIASSFMGALSGSGPCNVMTTGAITIPAMKRTGFPPELAANIESNASYMGNMIPPSSNIVAAFGAFVAVCPDSKLSQGEFWIVLWGISFWFILQRLIMVFAFCKYYGVKPMEKSELPSIKETLKTGWQGLVIPIVIILPFVLDSWLKDGFFTDRLGASGAKYMSSSILLFIAGVAAIYSIAISKDKKIVTPNAMASLFAKGTKSLVAPIGTCLFGYMIGSLFADLGVSEELQIFIADLHFGKLGMVVFITLFTCFLGMVIPGSSLVVVFGPAFITALSSTGVNPVLAAAMLPCICGVMCGITPPLALGMYAGMSLANSDFSKTVKNDLWWVFSQYALEIVVLMGWIPVVGL